MENRLQELYNKLDALTCDDEVKNARFDEVKRVCHEIVTILNSRWRNVESNTTSEWIWEDIK